MILDASMAIALLNPSDAYHQNAADILLDAADEGFRIPHLTLAETLVAHVRAGTEQAALTRLTALTVVADVPGPEPVKLARLRNESGLKLPDCVVLLAAMHSSESLATFDKRLADEARRHQLDVRTSPD